jgi:hypothetical protein
MEPGWYRIFLPNWAWAREFLIVMFVLLAYFAVNMGSADRQQAALENGRRLISIEESLGIFHEVEIQNAIIDSPIVPLFTTIYVFIHPITTLGFIAVLFLSGSDRYPYIRYVFVIFSLASFTIFYLYPTAPPRLLPEYGFVDLVHQRSPLSYESDLARTFLNPYAAMPSVHFGYSLIIGAMIFKMFHNWSIKSLGVGYTLLMLVSIVASANHLIIDCLASVLILSLIYYLVARMDLPSRLIRIIKGIAGRANNGPRA